MQHPKNIEMEHFSALSSVLLAQCRRIAAAAMDYAFGLCIPVPEKSLKNPFLSIVEYSVADYWLPPLLSALQLFKLNKEKKVFGLA